MAILFDTGYLLAFYNTKDVNHSKVAESYKALVEGEYGIPILLDYVFDELVTLIQVRTKRNDLATEIGRLILEDTKEFVQFVKVGQRDFEGGWRLFQEQTGSKFLSFTDCVLIAYAGSNNISKVAGLDNQFRSFLQLIPEDITL